MAKIYFALPIGYPPSPRYVHNNMTPQTLYSLIDKYVDGTATEPEKALLEQYYTRLDKNGTNATLPADKDALRDVMYQNISQAIAINGAKVVPLYRKPVFKIVAAAVVLFIVFGLWFMVSRSKNETPPIAVTPKTDVPAPASNRAMITLANGQVVYLDSADNGTLATQGNVTLVKTADGKIIYQSTDQPINQSTAYNTLTNPRGSKVIDMALADGSHVWLNAGSSVKYPVAFVGNDRKVEITGEAYFEVAHDKTKPFIVSKGDMEVQVLGTHFNVNAYDDEDDIKVTLLEGSVKVGNKAGDAIIKPGEQAVIASGAKQPKITNNIDLAEVMSWKNGFFQFNRASLQYVMKQLTRWYDVEVVYEAQPEQRQFVGEMERTLSLAQVLKILEKNGVKFRIDGKKIIVMK
jgi:transmembrane sensor